jgi:dUTP pyrophosphatase
MTAPIQLKLIPRMVEYQGKEYETFLTQFPEYATPGAAGVDLRAFINEPITLRPGEVSVIPTGFALHIADPEIVGKVYPRSGLGIKAGLVLANGTGVIDSDYQGEIMVAAWNRNFECWEQGPGDRTLTINPGDRIAQLVFERIVRPDFVLVSEFSNETSRGAGRFGSTGGK